VAVRDLKGDGETDLAFASPFYRAILDVVQEPWGPRPVYGPELGATFFFLGPDFAAAPLRRSGSRPEER